MRSMLLNTSALPAHILFAPEKEGNEPATTNKKKVKYNYKVGDKESGEAIGIYKPGDQLNTNKNIADLVRQHVAAADAEKGKHLETVKDEDILAEFFDEKNKATEDLSLFAARIDAVMNAKFAVILGLEDVPTMKDLRIAERVSAIGFGKQVSQETSKHMAEAVQAALIAEAGPRRIAYDLKAQFENTAIEGSNRPFLYHVPPVGSKFQPANKNGRKPPFGYKVPDDTSEENKDVPVWSGDWHHYTRIVVTEKGTERKSVNWFVEFTAAGLGVGLTERIDHLRNAIGNVDPEHLKTIGAKPYPKDIDALRKDGMKAELDAMLSDTLYQFDRRVRVVTKAFELIQAELELNERFPEYTVELFQLRREATIEAATRATKPYVLVQRFKNTKGETETREVGGAFKQTALTTAIRRLHTPQAQANKSLKIMELFSKQPKAPDQSTAEKKTSTTVPEVKDIDQFIEYIYSMHGYVGERNKRDLIRRQCMTPKGGQLCNAIVKLSDLLDELGNDKDIRARSDAYEKKVMQQVAAGEANAA